MDMLALSKARIVLNALNRVLAPFNVHVETCTLARQEARRLDEAVARDDFEKPLYVVPDAFGDVHYREILAILPRYSDRFSSFSDSSRNPVRYQYSNGYYTSPDAEILYSMVRMVQPKRIVEVGCGNSTKIVRQAIIDGDLVCHHICIDPLPREEISAFADIVIREKIENVALAEILEQIGAGDILFIDTSHEVAPANDVAHIYGRLLPAIPAGVTVHIHDIFLPFEYPLGWVRDLGLKWGEQYVVHALLSGGDRWEVLWPGYYLQRTLPEFASHFPNIGGGIAQSLWLRKRAVP